MDDFGRQMDQGRDPRPVYSRSKAGLSFGGKIGIVISQGAFIAPLRPTRSSDTPPSDRVAIGMRANALGADRTHSDYPQRVVGGFGRVELSISGKHRLSGEFLESCLIEQ
jgi:hypothetical protein